MDERISVFIDQLKSQLDGVPQEEVLKAVGFYEEYLYDALEAGKDLDQLLMQMDSPEKIAGMIKTETSIIRAQNNPGLRSFASVLKNVLMGVTTPFALILFSIFIIVSYSIVLFLFASAFALLIGAIVVFLGMFYEAFNIPFRYVPEIGGTLGMGFVWTGISLLVALGFYKLARLLIRISTALIRRVLKNPGKPMPVLEGEKTNKKSSPRRIVLGFCILFFAGFILFSVSGLPVRFLTIFNSMKPKNIIHKAVEYNTSEINKISVVTAHSHIRLVKNSTDKIIITYEQPDWLDYEIAKEGSMLSFNEKSNGRLPLFDLVKLHESLTELVISIPEGYNPEIITAETTGGFVYVTGLAENILVNTYSGSIFLKPEDAIGKFNTIATSKVGIINIDGKNAVHQTNGGFEYYNNINANKTIELRSARGYIEIATK